jgi:hypothetical protein
MMRAPPSDNDPILPNEIPKMGDAVWIVSLIDINGDLTDDPELAIQIVVEVTKDSYWRMFVSDLVKHTRLLN